MEILIYSGQDSSVREQKRLKEETCCGFRKIITLLRNNIISPKHSLGGERIHDHLVASLYQWLSGDPPPELLLQQYPKGEGLYSFSSFS